MKFRSSVIGMVAAVVVVGCMAGCESSSDSSGGGGGNSLAGTWNWKNITVNGVTIPLSVAGLDPDAIAESVTAGGSTTINMSTIQSLAQDLGYTVNGSVSVTFNADLSMSINYNLSVSGPEGPQSQSDTATGSYTINGNTLTITPDGEDVDAFSVTFSVSGDTLTLSVSNQDIQDGIEQAEGAGYDPSSQLTGDQLAILQALSGQVVFTRD